MLALETGVQSRQRSPEPQEGALRIRKQAIAIAVISLLTGLAFASTSNASATTTQSANGIENTSVIAAHPAHSGIAGFEKPRNGSLHPATGCASNVWVQMDGTNYIVCAYGTGSLSVAGHTFNLLFSNVPNRIWLHQTSTGGGWADCFRAQFASWTLSGRDRTPGNIQVSANTAAC